MGGDILHLDRTEGAQAYMQGHKSKVDPFFPDPVQQFIRKMEAGGRRRGGAAVSGVDRLVHLGIFQLMGDIGGQGHLAQPVQDFFKDPFVLETDQAVAVLNDLQDLGGQQAVPEGHPGAGAEFLAGPYQGLPYIPGPALQEQDFGVGPGPFLGAQEPGRNDPGIVQDQGIARIQIIYDIPEDLMLDLSGLSVHDQHPGQVSVLHGILGDQFLGQVEPVVRRPQACLCLYRI